MTSAGANASSIGGGRVGRGAAGRAPSRARSRVPAKAGGPARKAHGKARGKLANWSLPWPVFLLVLTLLCPKEIWVQMGSLVFSPYRVVLLIFFVPGVAYLFTARRHHATDWLMIAQAVFVFISLAVVHGASRSLETGGIWMVESLGAYAVGRRFMRRPEQFRSLVKMLIIVVSILACLTVPGMFLGIHVIRGPLRMALGLPPMGDEVRHHLVRMAGPFAHPILYGVFCSSVIGLAFYVGKTRVPILRARWARIALLVGATVSSLSSGAAIAATTQFASMAYYRLTRKVEARWLLLAILLVCGYVGIDLLSNRTPIRVFISYMTLSPASGYWRLLIFQYGSAEVWRHPLFGIGFHNWQRPGWMHSASVDNFWLLVAMRYGLPAFLSVAGATLWQTWRLARMKRVSRDVHWMRVGWVTAMVALIIAAATVDYWGALFVYLFFFLGAGTWMLDSPRLGRKRPAAQNPAVAGHQQSGHALGHL